MHLVVAITPHGYGHASQVAPVLSALQHRLPELRLTLLSTLPEAFLRSRIRGQFQYIHHAADFGLIMKSALEVDLAASADRYRAVHADWPAAVARESRLLADLGADCVLADVPYITLAAAAKLGVPVAALCSLNWADIYRHYFSQRPEAGDIIQQMQAAYRAAQVFYCPQPAMPMPWLENRHAVATIARRGRPQRERIRQWLGLDADAKLVLVATGGVDSRLPVDHWPRHAGVSWLVPDSWRVDHPDMYPLSAAGLAFTDVLASVDVVIGKCGYGMVSECVVNATPMLYLPRPDWPEEPCLVAWMQQHRACLPLPEQDIRRGDVLGSIDACMALEVIPALPGGAQQVAQDLSARLLAPAER